MKTYRCRDTLGRVWEVTHEAVKEWMEEIE